MRIGLDIGSTTIKCVVLDDAGEIAFSRYQRHKSQIAQLAEVLLHTIKSEFPGETFSLGISGSAGMGLAEELGIDFLQEVYATRVALRRLVPEADVAIELGGEDAKILFLTGAGGLEVRMNGTCAGGTGAFIDQMATLMDVSVEQLEPLSAHHQRSYAIASRCGVFAKSDIQPLLNQGAKKEDVARSIFEAVAGQTIAGLAQGREIAGNVVYLGGPLTFFSQLRDCFDQALGIEGIHPENSLYFVSIGAALQAERAVDLDALIPRIRSRAAQARYAACPPLFRDEAEYRAFRERHARARIDTVERPGYDGKVYIGIDAGSTTIKAVVIDGEFNLLKTAYLSNKGNPLPAVRKFLEEFYAEYPRATVAGAGATGYGEALVKAAFRLDGGVVETVAHFIAARQLQPDVDFIIDIGGQDIKCFRIKDAAIDDIFLNEACSSGCGSFIQTFAAAWGLPVDEFARRGLLAKHPVDLGSRCTVFMNSSVKQAQKDGATLEDISAGLSISIVKNALYKVIRTANASELGEHIVVQGGTFLNDAVLRAFEREIGKDVVRPNIAGLMGAYGVAVWSAGRAKPEGSSMLTPEELSAFAMKTTNTRCQGCKNHCMLNIIQFDKGRRFISGNRCEKMTGSGRQAMPNLYEVKRRMIRSFMPGENRRGRIGIPMGLNLYELFPFWHRLFTQLGFEVVQSPESDHALYAAGQRTIPSDTACYPAKLMHGHVEWLLKQGVDAIFYPCLSYNFDEHRGDNHYNCPVVAYYPEVLRLNVPGLKQVKFISDYLGIHRPRDFEKKFAATLDKYFPDIPRREVRDAVRAAYAAYDDYMARVRARGQEMLREARAAGIPVVVLCGRPYHIDPEISHGIDQQIAQLGAVVVTEDSVNLEVQKFSVNVLNQWTYHSRLYSAAQYVAECSDPGVNLVQLVSFGCGVDAITTDEVRRILADGGKLYTQLKIDEITNPGAVRIRLRSLFAALGQEER